MDLSLESAIEAAAAGPGLVAGRPLEEWNAAYQKVERYFNALRVGNKLLLGQLVLRVIDRAIRRASREPDRPAVVLAGEEVDRVVSEWFSSVLGGSADPGDPSLRSRGCLALLLADMPGRWQDQFLKPEPWPVEFVQAMRESFLRAGPDFQVSQMTPRPMDLGPMTKLSALSSLPYFRMALAWIAFAALLVVAFEIIH